MEDTPRRGSETIIESPDIEPPTTAGVDDTGVSGKFPAVAVTVCVMIFELGGITDDGLVNPLNGSTQKVCAGNAVFVTDNITE